MSDMSLKLIGITPAKEKQFHKKGICSMRDLVNYLPRRYKDFTRETGILEETEVSCITAVVNRVLLRRGRIDTITAFCHILPQRAPLLVTWFSQNYLYETINSYIGKTVYIAAHIKYDETYKNYTATMPELFEPDCAAARRIVPVYSKIAGMSNDYLTGSIHKAMLVPSAMQDTLPSDIVRELHLLSTPDALKKLHQPVGTSDISQARRRMTFDELLFFALQNEWASRSSCASSPFSVRNASLFDQILSTLPYSLTSDQQACVSDILLHLKHRERLNALVQGDVGCGKTIIAFLSMAAVVGSGYQAVLMAPTQVLAKQHYEDLCKLVLPYGCKVVYLGSEMKASEKKAVKAAIKTGEAQFIVGTHSVIGPDIVYHNLALTVADEEHKFGVAQRKNLIEKASAGVHSITMSATPIPRTLAQVIYGNGIQLYNIATMPAGRLPIITGIAKSREKIYSFLRSEIKKGHQAYIVCPMIEQNDDLAEVKSVEEIGEEYWTNLYRDGIRVATLTGKDSAEHTKKTLEDFKSGMIDILISTTVIEVGVNVPNATVMVISSADRFGLSSLHQLRGRVGRSNLQSYCVLESETQTEKGRQRLDAMCSTTNGFEIARADLEIRGAGDFLGTKQSGDNKYIALMLAYPDIYRDAQLTAKKLLSENSDCPMMQRFRDAEEEFEHSA